MGEYAYDEPPRQQARSRRQPREYRRESRAGSRVFGGLIAFILVVVAIFAVTAVLSNLTRDGSVTDEIAQRTGDALGIDASSGGEGQPSVDVPTPPAEPQGQATWVLTEDELNQRIAARAGSFGPAENIEVSLNDGTISVDFSAYGVPGTYHGSIVAQNGVPVVADSEIEGPIGWAVSSDRIDEVLNQEIANAVAEQQVSVESVHVQPGQMVFGISGG